MRDNQRSRVYRWERNITDWFSDRPLTESLDEVQEWINPIWRAERGRVGLAGCPPPLIIKDPKRYRGRRHAMAFYSHEIALPKWARNPWVVLHELAHRLTPHDEPHGPRFVGVLMGLACRYDNRDIEELRTSAEVFGVRYYERSIGRVREKSLSERLFQMLPIRSETEAAIELGVHWRQVRGAVLSLQRKGMVVSYRGLVRRA